MEKFEHLLLFFKDLAYRREDCTGLMDSLPLLHGFHAFLRMIVKFEDVTIMLVLEVFMDLPGYSNRTH